MAARANWKGFLRIAEIACPVALYTAASTSERIAFHTINRETGHRVRRQFIDEQTGKPVDAEDQVKGYEVGQGDFVILEPDEIAAAIPNGDKTLTVESFIAFDQVDDLFFDKPYYLAPSDKVAAESFAVIREGMRKNRVAALARAVLFRRVRTVLITAHDNGLIATTLNFDYEVRSATEAFADIPKIEIKGEMLELAQHIIGTKRGSFDPKTFDDRYEAALADVIRAKQEGKPIKAKPAPASGKVVDLMEALRQSAGAKPSKADKTANAQGAAKPAKKRAAPKARLSKAG